MSIRRTRAELLYPQPRRARFKRLRVALLSLLFIAPASHAAWQTPGTPTQDIAQAPALTATVTNPSYFSIKTDDVARAVSEQLAQQGIESKSDVSLAPGTPVTLANADHPLKLVVHALQVDPNARRWQAQANILADGKTVSVKPVSGTYIGLVEVPVLTRQLGREDVIEASDLSTKAVPKLQLRKETVTQASQLIGQSPRKVISSDRPIRLSEINAPLVIKKGDAVQMRFKNEYMNLRATGIALEDGAVGELIRVKNDKSEKAVSGKVAASGEVDVSPSVAM